ncbi:MAG TPA: DUF2182 domain-containing protein [Nitrospinota bacterium]|nr:DUF2182 domain-containing protein [Nitrospinota bacterium]
MIHTKPGVIAGIAVLTLFGWAYIFWMALIMDVSSSLLIIPQSKPWTLFYATMVFIMWAIMMIAMMLPSASPAILIYEKIVTGKSQTENPLWLTTLFTSSYLLTWMLFSLAATAAQWWLHSVSYLSPMMAITDKYIGGAILIAASVYQVSPIKDACLKHCRSPMGYFITNWRDGAKGSFTMGFMHGMYCVGCCWALMAVLFFTGMMNLLWVVAISIFVLVEKITSTGDKIAYLSAFLLFFAGLWVILG